MEELQKSLGKIIPKPWGEEVQYCENEHYGGKILKLNKGKRTSLHYHKHTDKFHFVLTGEIELQVGKKQFSLKSNEGLRILPGVIHRIYAKKKTLLLEVSTPETKKDIVRIEDDYGRLHEQD